MKRNLIEINRSKSTQLIYRGINYQPQFSPSKNLHTSAVAGKYRGVSYYIRPKNAVLEQSLAVCKYRGIDYIKRFC